MEVYLNVIELGDGVYGAEAASEHYFKRHASDITTYQAASLASIVPAPLKWRLSDPIAVSRQAWVMQQMANFGGVLIYHPKEVTTVTHK